MVRGNLALNPSPSKEDCPTETKEFTHIKEEKTLLQFRTPLKWCSISLDEVITHGARLEASVFDVKAMNAEQLVMSNPFGTAPLLGPKGICQKAFYGSRAKRNYVPSTHENAIGFIGSSEMLDCCPKPVKFMMNSSRVDDLRVQYGDILLSRSGTIGNVAFVNRTLEKFLISEHAIRLVCKIFPGYVYAYLKSEIGQSLIKSKVFGAVIQEIEPVHLASIPIPDAPEELRRKIDSLIIRSYELRDESNDLIDQAERLLATELRLPPVVDFGAAAHPFDSYAKISSYIPNVKTFDCTLCKLSGRFDASYHLPIAEAITEHLRRYAVEVTTVGDKRVSHAIILPGRFKRVYVEEGYGCVFIGGKQISELDPSNKKYLSLKHHNSTFP